ncbi:Integrase core domain-containing protein [Nitrosomonas ureae]|uniref:Integrase core domain-containing protein n=1 Tax=Nitrosomonas ureae TaxID=44577 RepID=A0A1H2DUC0_9PROT|nr:hypothetical protein ATY38_04355 [Nitrosomonas ureae]SDT86421.1 Integrase core domain-containing protein [Nitrosomonas ureae]
MLKVGHKSEVSSLITFNQENHRINAYVERYNKTVRHEGLEMNEFSTIEEAQLTATQWLWIYNNERLSMVPEVLHQR